VEAELAGDPAKAESALLTRLSKVPDQRARRGLRHALVVVLALSACATLVVGGDSIAAIWQWAARASQEKVAGLGAYRDPLTGRFVVPSERTFRRILQTLDAETLDVQIGRWGADVAQGRILDRAPASRTRLPTHVERGAHRSSPVTGMSCSRAPRPNPVVRLWASPQSALEDTPIPSSRRTRERRSCPHDVHMTAHKIEYDDLVDHVLAGQKALDLEPAVGVEPTTYRLQV
jgi:DDE_Tnp_1-associated